MAVADVVPTSKISLTLPTVYMKKAVRTVRAIGLATSRETKHS